MPLQAAHVGPEGLRNRHRAVGLLVVLQDGRHGAPTARPEPFRVWTNSALAPASGRYRMLARLAWKSAKLLQEEISTNLFWPGIHTSGSYFLAAVKPRSAVHIRLTR